MRNRQVGWGLLLLAAAGCTSLNAYVKPEGNGGWDSQRRRDELAQRAARAGVTFPQPETVAAPRPRSEILDLASVVAMAAHGNRRIAEATTSLAMAAEGVNDTRGRLLPSTIGSGRYTWYTDPLGNQIHFPAVPVSAITIRDEHFGTINGTLTLPIDLSGELRQTLKAAQAGYRGEQARLWATTLEQEVAAVRSYFQLLETLRLREVTEQTLAVDRAQLDTANARFANGRITKNDLLVTQVALRNAEQDLVRRNLAIDQARRQLNQVIGTDVDAPTQIVDVHERPDLPEINDLLQQAYEHNPALVGLVEERQRLEANATALERSRLPRLNAGGAIDYSTSAIVQPQQVGSGFAGFSWDLGTDTRREAQIAEAHLALDRNRVATEAAMRELENAIRSTRDVVAERLSALSTSAAAVGQAEENLRIRQQQFTAGRAQSDDVLLAEALLSQQRATLASALYQAHARRAELQQLLGLALDPLLVIQR
ncbi:MAG: TolC family protein [Deltaproteobacteria bacterium]|nr:TolC family protein [Deltaproteobacteria bacterium]